MAAHPEMTFEEEQLIFFALIGQAIHEWSHVESRLADLAARCVGHSDQLYRAFFSIENFRAKLGFVDEAIRSSRILDQFASDWATIHTRVQSLAAKRNAIAHSRKLNFPGRPGRRVAIVPFLAKAPKRKSAKPVAPSGSLCVKDLDLIAMQFQTVAWLLVNLDARIGVLLGSPPTPFAEVFPIESQPRSLDKIRRLTLGALPPREQSSRA